MRRRTWLYGALVLLLFFLWRNLIFNYQIIGSYSTPGSQINQTSTDPNLDAVTLYEEGIYVSPRMSNGRFQLNGILFKSITFTSMDGSIRYSMRVRRSWLGKIEFVVSSDLDLTWTKID